MNRNLFFQPKYTIDTSALLTLMNEGEKYEKKVFKNLWNDFCKLCKDGIIVSHIEVFKEIKNGGMKEHIEWAKANENIFQYYNLNGEVEVIREIGKMDAGFVKFLEQGKQKSVHADPWVVAQAKVEGLIVIIEERQNKNYRIPHVCRTLGVRSIDILGLVKEEKLTY